MPGSFLSASGLLDLSSSAPPGLFVSSFLACPWELFSKCQSFSMPLWLLQYCPSLPPSVIPLCSPLSLMPALLSISWLNKPTYGLWRNSFSFVTLPPFLLGLNSFLGIQIFLKPQSYYSQMDKDGTLSFKFLKIIATSAPA